MSDVVDAQPITSPTRAPSVASEPVWPIPSSLSPSRVSAFTSCPMQFRFSSVQRLPEPPGVATTRGSVVHRALELLFELAPPERTPAALTGMLDRALEEYATDADYVGLRLDEAGATSFRSDCDRLIEKYFDMEDPTKVRDIGLEVRMAADVGSLELRGIIDRLELDDNGDLVVTDYKTGRAPSGRYEQKSLAGVHFYSFLCEAVLGKRPAKIRLMYLSNGETIETIPSQQSVRFINTRTTAVWKAVERACTTGDFRPNQSRLCDWCSFKQWCPAFGGDPDLAATEAVAAHEALVADGARAS
ncbi:MAG: PD-(D/E)XK nuclease family protein [Ilumatobacter sp.]|uniref:RecB family exonuclease n=1 Tax=Ilumatobacter sp. TaxID=1967498 RepID=UPI0032976A81